MIHNEMFFFILCLLAIRPSVAVEEFGDFKIVTLEATECKNKNWSPVITASTVVTHSNGTQDLVMEVNASATTGPVGCVINVHLRKGGKLKPIMHYKLSSLCEHFMTRQFAATAPYLTNDCYVKQGVSGAKIRDMNQFFHTFIGENFVYGFYEYMVKCTASKYRISCTKFVTEIKKIETYKSKHHTARP